MVPEEQVLFGTDAERRGDPAPRSAARSPPTSCSRGSTSPQRAAVTHAGSPLLVVAGAGSGKTRVLTRRIAWLISERGAHPGSILAITFTNKAAAEMRERVEDLVGRRARIMWVSTFHSACVRILRKEIERFGYKSSFSIYDAADSKRLMTLVARDLDLDPKRFPPRAILNWVSNQKNELVDHEEAAGRHPQRPRGGLRRGLRALPEAPARRERPRLRRPHHDDGPPVPGVPRGPRDLPAPVPPRARRRVPGHQPRAVRPHPRAVRPARRPARCASVGDDPDLPDDDTGVGASELMVVGDADQSIYAFRGANIRNILQFEEDFPDARTILLEQNYRSTQNILDAANAVIERNKGRKSKHLWSDQGTGEQIVGYVADDEHDEARFISDRDRPAHRRGVGQAPRRRGVLPHQRPVPCVRGGLHPGRHALQGRRRRALLRARARSATPWPTSGCWPTRPTRSACAAILNVPKRGIGERAEACVEAMARRDGTTFWEALRHAAGRPRHRHPLGHDDQAVRRHGRGAAVDGRRGGAGRRRARADPGAQRLPRRARGQRRPAGRDPGGEPRRARRGRPRVLRRAGAAAVGRPRRPDPGPPRRPGVPRAGLARRRLRPDPRPGRRGAPASSR